MSKPLSQFEVDKLIKSLKEDGKTQQEIAEKVRKLNESKKK